jgi:hypothetical protein
MTSDEEYVNFSGGGGFGDEMEEEGNGGEEEEEMILPPLPPLGSVFDCAYINQTPSGWECTWCGKSFVGKHSTRALRHVMKKANNNVGVCRGTIPDNYLGRYEGLS